MCQLFQEFYGLFGESQRFSAKTPLSSVIKLSIKPTNYQASRPRKTGLILNVWGGPACQPSTVSQPRLAGFQWRPNTRGCGRGTAAKASTFTLSFSTRNCYTQTEHPSVWLPRCSTYSAFIDKQGWCALRLDDFMCRIRCLHDNMGMCEDEVDVKTTASVVLRWRGRSASGCSG